MTCPLICSFWLLIGYLVPYSLFTVDKLLVWKYITTKWMNCSNCNRNCNWGTCIALPTKRPRAHHRVNPYPGAHRQNETEMFSDHDETSLSIAAVSAPSVACSMLAMQQQNCLVWLCRQFVDVSAARRGCHTVQQWSNSNNGNIVVTPVTANFITTKLDKFEIFSQFLRTLEIKNESNAQSFFGL